MGTKIEDKESVIRCKDCQFYEPDSIFENGERVFVGANGMCQAWHGCKSSEDGYCHLAALRPEKMTIDKAIEILSRKAFVIAENIGEWKEAKDLLVDTARKYQKIEEQVEWSENENHKIDAARMIQIKEIIQDQGAGR